MKLKARIKVLGMTFSLIELAAGVSMMSPVFASDEEQSLVAIGFKIAPVHLKLEGKNRDLVGLGSFIVNAQGDCNSCHTSGGSPNYAYVAGGNPYFGQPLKVDPARYLAGGSDFGPAAFPGPIYPPSEYGTYVGPNIISRNLTPDKTGRPAGGRTLAQFIQIFRAGTDLDRIHPTCTAASPSPTPAYCVPPPVDGSLLQVMPWPIFQHMTDHQLEAIYEYLSAIPCIDNTKSAPPEGAPNELRNDCGN